MPAKSYDAKLAREKIADKIAAIEPLVRSMTLTASARASVAEPDSRGEPGRIDAGAALHRHAERRGGARPAVRPGGEGQQRITSSRRTGRCGGWCPRSAGPGMPGCRTGRARRELNYVSIGIEIVNPGHEWGYRPFPEAQMAAVEALCRDLVARHRDPGAPGRRPFRHRARPQGRPRRIVRLAAPGPRRDRASGRAGARPCAGGAAAGSASSRARRGARPTSRGSATRSCPATRAPALAAFQRRFRPERWDGRLDGETAARLAEVRAAYDEVRHNRRAERRERFNAYRRMN